MVHASLGLYGVSASVVVSVRGGKPLLEVNSSCSLISSVWAVSVHSGSGWWQEQPCSPALTPAGEGGAAAAWPCLCCVSTQCQGGET